MSFHFFLQPPNYGWTKPLVVSFLMSVPLTPFQRNFSTFPQVLLLTGDVGPLMLLFNCFILVLVQSPLTFSLSLMKTLTSLLKAAGDLLPLSLSPTIFPCTRTTPNPPPLLMMNYVIEKKNYNKGNSAKMYLPTHAHAVIFLFILSSAHLGGRCVLTLEVCSSAWVFIFFCLLYNIYCFLSTNYFASPHPSQTCINTSHL